MGRDVFDTTVDFTQIKEEETGAEGFDDLFRYHAYTHTRITYRREREATACTTPG
jgi:hypothetical protein